MCLPSGLTVRRAKPSFMTQTLKEKLDALPEPLQKEVEDFVDFLLSRRAAAQPEGFSFSWAGGLRDLKEETTSVESQHQASEWR